MIESRENPRSRELSVCEGVCSMSSLSTLSNTKRILTPPFRLKQRTNRQRVGVLGTGIAKINLCPSGVTLFRFYLSAIGLPGDPVAPFSRSGANT